MPTGGSEPAADRTLGGLIKDNQQPAFQLNPAKNGPASRSHFTSGARVPDGLTISLAPFREQLDDEAPLISYRITASSNNSADGLYYRISSRPEPADAGPLLAFRLALSASSPGK